MKVKIILSLIAAWMVTDVNSQSNNSLCAVPAWLTGGIGGCADRFDNVQNIKFYLANRANPNYNQIFVDNDTNHSFYDSSIPACFIIHGWSDNYNAKWIQFTKSEWLKTVDCNIIAVDWSCLAINYLTAVTQDMQTIGFYIVKLIEYLFTTKSLSFSQTTIFGHSLGAQIAGFIGKYINSLNQTQIGKMYASDAAGICVTYPMLNPTNFRLVSTDATYVQVLHCTDGLIGVNIPCGDADVYFNKGNNTQCGCGIPYEIDFISPSEPACSHLNCNLYFAYSLAISNVYSAKQVTSLTRSYLKMFDLVTCATTRITEFYNEPGTYMTVGIHGQPLNGLFTVITTPSPPHCAQLSAGVCPANATAFSFL